MRKIFIKNYKSIYDEICIDISLNNQKQLVAFVGHNGIGKSNILSALYWLLVDRSSEKNITTKFGSQISSNPAEVTLVQTPSKFLKDKIIEIIKNNSNSWNFENESFASLDSAYIIANKKENLIKKSFQNNYVDKNNQKYNSILPIAVNVLLEKGKKLLLNAGIDISELITTDDNNNPIWYNTEIYDNYLYIQAANNVNEEDQQKIKLPLTRQKYNILLNIKKDIEKIVALIVDSVKFDVNYIKNADLENKTETTYSLSELLSDDRKDSASKITDFLNFYFNFSEKLNNISNYQQNKDLNKNNSASYELKIAELIDELNISTQNSINKLFDNFDIYAKPRFRFQNNLLLVSVENKDNFEIYDPETENNSSGYKAFIEFIIMLHSVVYNAKKNPEKMYILMADEPDKNLHIYLQRQLIASIFKEIKNLNNVLVIYTTHSPYLISIEKGLIYSVNKSTLKDVSKNLFLKSGTTFINEINIDGITDLKDNKISLSNIATVLESINYSSLNKELYKDILKFSIDVLNNRKIIYKAYDEKKNENTRIAMFVDFAVDQGYQLKSKTDFEEDSKDFLENIKNFSEVKEIKASELKDKEIVEMDKILSDNFKTNILILID